MWDSKITSVIVRFNGHRSAITALAFDDAGVRLASGAKDTDIIIWDLVAETGLFRLRGHKDQVTALAWLRARTDRDGQDDSVQPSGQSDENGNGIDHDLLLTTGKDSLIKIWDLDAQHCIETRVTQPNGECWAMTLSPDHSGCLTAGNDGEIKVWSIDLKRVGYQLRPSTTATDGGILSDRGTIYRQGKDRALGIHFHPTRDYFAVHGNEKAVEIWRIRSGAEVQRSLSRKRKRLREKKAGKSEKDNGATADEGDDETAAAAVPGVTDIFVLRLVVRTGGKIRSVDWAATHSRTSLQLLVTSTNNQLEYYNIAERQHNPKRHSDDPPEYNRMFAVDLPGHRTDVRALAVSYDQTMLASASNGTIKIWNIQTGSCIRTFECGYALCCTFAPRDQVIIVGTKSGKLEMYEIASASCTEVIDAHDGPVWTLKMYGGYSYSGLVSGGADKSVHFWNLKTHREPVLGSSRTHSRLGLVKTRTLKVHDDVLSLCISHDDRLIAVSLLDNTVKVFFLDSLRLYLNLYGHKLPVLSMDISLDNRLIITCSADKNVRIWGLDFGDCHKAIFAHQDSIMQVKFLGNGHQFISVGKDRLVKYWDGDKFEQIQKLQGHHGEIWALAVSGSGNFFVTASHDRSIRVWEETDEPIFLEEEREKELEQLYESTLTASLGQHPSGNDEMEVAPAGKQTTETLVTGERIMEALELGMADLELMREWTANHTQRSSSDVARKASAVSAPPARHPLFIARGNISAEEHVLSELQKVPAAALHDTLLVLPFSLLPALFTFLDRFASTGRNIPLTCRVLFFVLKVHQRQLVASKLIRPLLGPLSVSLRAALQGQKDEIGYNLAAVRLLSNNVKESGQRYFVDPDLDNADADDGRNPFQPLTTMGTKKRAFVDLA